MMDSIRRSLAQDEPVLGAWVSMADGQSIEIMGRAGYEFLVLDTQHGAITWDRLLTALQILDGKVPVLVRVGWRDPEQIMRAADLGAAGVIVPMVSNAAEAKVAAEALRYPPAGHRSYGPVRSYYQTPAERSDPLCMAMIETAEGLQNVDAIAATPGIDGLFVGPVDLALSLGHGVLLTMTEPVLRAIGQVVTACERHKIIAGSASLGMASCEALLRCGIRFLTLGSDAGHLRRAAQAEAEQGRALKKTFVRSP
jgi:4-hydroxy-2-oxoheptanedioate aldolase